MVLDDVDVCVQVKHLLEGGNEALLVKEVGALADCRQGGSTQGQLHGSDERRVAGAGQAIGQELQCCGWNPAFQRLRQAGAARPGIGVRALHT